MQAVARLKKGKTLLGKEGVFTPLIKEFLEAALDRVLEVHIESDEESNRNGIHIKLLAELSHCPLVLDGFKGNLVLEFRTELAPC